jgi:alpha-galactosidase
MRDAGYKYLVIDDAWMAPERDKNGRLQVDPNKFPSGMKALGDYLHGKGLKFGIYQDRGTMTCQKLPGSFGHEDVDMQSFADWGVDYIKMDSCYAEKNGRSSADDYDIFSAAIAQTGRPMVLSIADYGNAAWIWDGGRSAQLWRTSYDIERNIRSAYECAETSSGSTRIHPAFNGLWQFAGPGRWNDPDMLQVGNMILPDAEREAADRAHFSLWCILAAPLMAGNDLREMNEAVRQILTAPEVIAVNQDPRGLQGFIVRDEGDLEIYNKPLADGTTAVLFLNKGKNKADLILKWSEIGLSGSQPVRDLWARKDLGEFKDSFTAGGLGQHGVQMLRIGRKGDPLPGPKPLAPERYRVTRPGTTYLSDLCYVWLDKVPSPGIDTMIDGTPITLDGRIYKKGLGCAEQTSVMFMTDHRANRFQAMAAVVDAEKDAAKAKERSGRFRVLSGDWFSNQVLWDSGDMKPGDKPKMIDIDIRKTESLLLEFKGKGTHGCWAEARVVADQ